MPACFSGTEVRAPDSASHTKAESAAMPRLSRVGQAPARQSARVPPPTGCCRMGGTTEIPQGDRPPTPGEAEMVEIFFWGAAAAAAVGAAGEDGEMGAVGRVEAEADALASVGGWWADAAISAMAARTD